MLIDRKYLKISSYFIFLSFIVFCFFYKLAWCLLAATATYSSLSSAFNFFDKKFTSNLAHKITSTFLILFIITFVSIFSLSIYRISHLSSTTISEITSATVNIIHQINNYIPQQYKDLLPDNTVELKNIVGEHIKSNSTLLFTQTATIFKGLTHIIIGIIIGAFMAFSSIAERYGKSSKPLTREIVDRSSKFLFVFNNVVMAQIKISLINTLLTSIFLVGVLPIFNVNLPYLIPIIILTFICGLIPIVGNLISNTVIVLFSLTASPYLAIVALIFLVVIHKLEYYINAKIIGTKINTKIWEMLIVMIIFETLFGVTGLAMSPIFYGYLKQELHDLNLV